jgi:hypothetical protein
MKVKILNFHCKTNYEATENAEPVIHTNPLTSEVSPEVNGFIPKVEDMKNKDSLYKTQTFVE